MNPLTLFFVIFAIFFYISDAKNLEAIVVSDVINFTKRPSAVAATLCWSTTKKQNFYWGLSETSNSHITMQFSDLNRDSEYDQDVVFVIDVNCQNVSEYFKKKFRQNYFRSPFRWILIGLNENDDVVPNALATIDILPDSDVLVARKNSEYSFELYYIYRICANSSWKKERFGYWNKLTGLIVTSNMTVPPTLRRLNLDGLQISICCVLTNKDSIDHLTDGINDHIDTITKVNFPTTNHLLDFLNASRKYIFTETWGYRVNGSWNGMTGFLIREEVEIGGSPMFFTSERISVVDYIASPTPTRSKFVFQQPKLSYENNLFLLSFRTSVWYSSVALIILLLLAIMLVGMWEWKKNKYNGEWENDNSGLLRPNLLDVMILIFGAVCQQGSPTELKGSLGRVVMLLLFIALMFLYTSYSANIVALLQSSSSKIRSLEDLLHSRLKFGVHDTVFNKYYFSTATEPVRKAIYEKKVAPPGTTPRFITMEEGVLKMRKGLFAFHMETGVGYKFVGKYFKEGEKCGLQEIQYLQVIDPWLAVRKNTPYKEMFKIGLKRIQEHGLQSRENRLLYEKRPKCSGRESNFVSVSMVDCYPALLILSYGCLLSLLLLFLELLVQRRRTVYRKLSCSKKINE